MSSSCGSWGTLHELRGMLCDCESNVVNEFTQDCKVLKWWPLPCSSGKELLLHKQTHIYAIMNPITNVLPNIKAEFQQAFDEPT